MVSPWAVIIYLLHWAIVGIFNLIRKSHLEKGTRIVEIHTVACRGIKGF